MFLLPFYLRLHDDYDNWLMVRLKKMSSFQSVNKKGVLKTTGKFRKIIFAYNKNNYLYYKVSQYIFFAQNLSNIQWKKLVYSFCFLF